MLVIKLSSDFARSVAQLPSNVFDVNEIQRTTRTDEAIKIIMAILKSALIPTQALAPRGAGLEQSQLQEFDIQC